MFDSADRHPYITIHDSNTLQKTVTSELHNRITRRHVVIARVVSFLLLGFIIYGSTAEAAHRHATVSELKSPVQGSSVSTPENENKLYAGLVGCGECLICQLHQDFSTTLIVERDASSPPRTRVDISQGTARIVNTLTNAPRRGRAPPFTS